MVKRGAADDAGEGPADLVMLCAGVFGEAGGCEGQPCIYDPATYYGHHEAEWGMSW